MVSEIGGLCSSAAQLASEVVAVTPPSARRPSAALREKTWRGWLPEAEWDIDSEEFVDQLRDPWGIALEAALTRLPLGSRNDSIAAALDSMGIHVHAIEGYSARWSARTWKVTEDCFLISGSTALRDALYGLTKLMVAEWDVSTPESSDAAASLPRLDHETALRIARVSIANVRQSGEWFRPIDVMLDENQAWLALELTELAEEFIILHEIGHILQGDFDGKPPAFFLGMGADLTEGPSDAKLYHVAELKADMWATVSLLGPENGKSSDPGSLSKRATAVRIAISVLGVLDDAHFWGSPATHPNAKDRLDACEQVMRTLLTSRYGLREDEAGEIVELFAPIVDPISFELLEMKYLPRYQQPLSEKIKGSGRLYVIDSQDALIDHLDESERLLHRTGIDHLRYLGEHYFGPPSSQIVEMTMADLASGALEAVGEGIDYHLRAMVGERGAVTRSVQEERMTTVVLGQLALFESALPALTAHSRSSKAITQAELMRQVIGSNVGAAWPAVVGALSKMRANMLPIIPVSRDYVAQVLVLDPIGDFDLSVATLRAMTLNQLSRYEMMYLARERGLPIWAGAGAWIAEAAARHSR